VLHAIDVFVILWYRLKACLAWCFSHACVYQSGQNARVPLAVTNGTRVCDGVLEDTLCFCVLIFAEMSKR
jgi:hypothetical protein